jgi:hypothetical protein
MGIESINEPNSSRTWMVTPVSINEPPKMDMPNPPHITSIAPTTAAIGDPSFTLVVTGTGFYPDSVIVFAGNDEPTTLQGDGTLTTDVNMAVWLGPDTLPVVVRNFNVVSNAVQFTFTATAASTEQAPAKHARVADPDEIEEEIEEAEEEGDFKPLHRGKPTHTLPHKRKK